MTIKYPEVNVQLVGNDGNAFAILGACKNAARKAGVEKAEIDLYLSEAMSGDYDHLLQVSMDWFNVC